MGIVKINRLQRYWAEDTAIPFVTKTFTQHRFVQLSSSWHIVGDKEKKEEKKHTEQDKLFKLKPLLDHVISKCKYYYRPSQYLSIDEQMIAYHGRNSLVQYMPMKPHRWGIKNFALCDASSTYVLNFMIYAGKTAGITEHGFADRVTMSLVEPWLNNGHIVVGDNYFSSMNLVTSLLNSNTGYIGTVRRGRKGFPKEFFVPQSSLASGESKIWQMKNEQRIIAAAWCDRKPVFLVSSVHSPNQQVTVKRRVKGEGKKEVTAPAIVPDYITSGRGVDRANKQLFSSLPGTQTARWWVRVAWWIINICVHNAYIIHRHQKQKAKQKPLNNNDFRLELAKALVNNYSSRKRTTSHPTTIIPTAHHLVSTTTTRDCHVCSSQSLSSTRKRTKYACSTCNLAVCPECYDAHCSK
jgi:hypothetical protein